MIYKKVKRLLDIVLSLIGLIILSPILIIVAIAIKLESKGPVIFQQERLGLNGNVFKIYKFRSMCVGAEKSGVYETKGDARVTRVGKFIRKTSIDEFPQFVNIIKGEMSIIGPRPTLTYHPWSLDEYTKVQCKRFNVRPGVTGWAQINGRKDVPWDKRIEYDVEYVENLSFVLDLKVFFKTIFKVLTMQDNVNVGETAKTAVAEVKENEVVVTKEESGK
ncbi:sugar transferase [Peribacillus butanolivorans]|uniref:sugar transferase n=1 Tax=Peribacillus butanolivorans TaxID=421767 RepID=UPI0039FC1978